LPDFGFVHCFTPYFTGFQLVYGHRQVDYLLFFLDFFAVLLRFFFFFHWSAVKDLPLAVSSSLP